MKLTLASLVPTLLLLLPSISAQALAPVFGQCGGFAWLGATECVPGSICTVLNYYFSQCIYIPRNPSTSTSASASASSPVTSSLSLPSSSSVVTLKTSTKASTTSAPSATPTEKLAALWAQCAGINFTGPTKCVPGATCLYTNPYFSFCRIVTSSSSAGATATATGIKFRA